MVHSFNASMLCYDVWRNLQRQCLITRWPLFGPIFQSNQTSNESFLLEVKAHLHASVKTCLDVLNLLEVETPKFRYQDTWLGMRITDSSGGNLVFRGDGTPQAPEAHRVSRGYPPWRKFSSQQLQGSSILWQVQWLHSFYFVLTVFTTVGFGVSRPFSEQMQWAANRFAFDLLMICSFETSWALYFIWLADFEGWPSSPKLASLAILYDNFKSNISWQWWKHGLDLGSGYVCLYTGRDRVCLLHNAFGCHCQ